LLQYIRQAFIINVDVVRQRAERHRMSLFNPTYEITTDMEKRLRFWLSMDAWGIDEAAQIFTGIDPEKTIKPKNLGDGSRRLGSVTLFNGLQIPEPPPEREYRLVIGEFSDSLEEIKEDIDTYFDDAEYERRKMEREELDALFKECANTARLFNNPSITPTTPKEWIERALAKNIEIPWLKWANKRNLFPDGLRETILALGKDGIINPLDKSTGEKEPRTPGHLDHDPQWQQKANEIAADLMVSKKRKPTKGEVAKHLAPKLGETVPTVERRIRKQW